MGVAGPSRWAATCPPPASPLAAVDADPRLLGAVAIHPNDAPELAAAGALEDALAEIDAMAAHPRIRAIGETGLDYFRTGPDGVAAQHHSFRAHLDIAKAPGPGAADPLPRCPR